MSSRGSSPSRSPSVQTRLTFDSVDGSPVSRSGYCPDTTRRPITGAYNDQKQARDVGAESAHVDENGSGIPVFPIIGSKRSRVTWNTSNYASVDDVAGNSGDILIASAGSTEEIPRPKRLRGNQELRLREHDIYPTEREGDSVTPVGNNSSTLGITQYCRSVTATGTPTWAQPDDGHVRVQHTPDNGLRGPAQATTSGVRRRGGSESTTPSRTPHDRAQATPDNGHRGGSDMTTPGSGRRVSTRRTPVSGRGSGAQATPNSVRQRGNVGFVPPGSARRSRVQATPGSARRSRVQATPDSARRSRLQATPDSARRSRLQATPDSERRDGSDMTTPGSGRRVSARRTPVSGKRRSPLFFEMPKQRLKERYQFIVLICKDEYRDSKPLLSSYARCAWCKKCKCEITYTRSNVYHIAKHVNTVHSVSMKQAQQLEDERQQRRKQTLVHVAAPAKATTSERPEPCSPDDQNRADDLLAIWVSKSMRPFSIVEDEYFVKFVEHLNSTKGYVTVPKTWKVRDRVATIAVKLRSTLKEQIAEQCDYYSASTDIWTSRSKVGFLSFTLHYLDPCFRMRSWVLECKRLHGKHDGSAIAAALGECMREWGLRKEKCTKFLRDGASNGKNACEKLQLNDMSCLAHCIHLVVGAAIVKKKCKKKTSKRIMSSAQTEDSIAKAVAHRAREEVDEFIEASCASKRKKLDKLRKTVEVFRKLARYFNKSSKGTDLLKDIQKGCRIVLVPQTDSPTRWNSTHFMLQRMLEIRPALEQFFEAIGRTTDFSDVNLVQPTAQEWTTIRCLNELLKPFAAATTALGGQTYPTLVVAVPIARHLQKEIENAKMFDSILKKSSEKFAAEVLTLMEFVRKTYVDLLKEKFLKQLPAEAFWVSMLDPRSAHLEHLSATEKTRARESLLCAAVEIAKEVIDVYSDTDCDISNNDCSNNDCSSNDCSNNDCSNNDCSNNSSSNHDGSNHIDETAASSQQEPSHAYWAAVFCYDKEVAPPDPDAPLRDRCQYECDQYSKELGVQPMKTDPLMWWEENTSKYPILSALARKWLGCIATSVPSERAFSTSGNVVSVKRCGLLPAIIRDTVFINENYEEYTSRQDINFGQEDDSDNYES